MRYNNSKNTYNTKNTNHMQQHETKQYPKNQKTAAWCLSQTETKESKHRTHARYPIY